MSLRIPSINVLFHWLSGHHPFLGFSPPHLPFTVSFVMPPTPRKIQRHLLLGRKAMTNLDSILKSRDITLSTKVCLVKAMVFLVVMYGCESWTIKKAECRRIDAF